MQILHFSKTRTYPCDLQPSIYPNKELNIICPYSSCKLHRLPEAKKFFELNVYFAGREENEVNSINLHKKSLSTLRQTGYNSLSGYRINMRIVLTVNF
jgi:hypothetical protein